MLKIDLIWGCYHSHCSSGQKFWKGDSLALVSSVMFLSQFLLKSLVVVGPSSVKLCIEGRLWLKNHQGFMGTWQQCLLWFFTLASPLFTLPGDKEGVLSRANLISVKVIRVSFGSELQRDKVLVGDVLHDISSDILPDQAQLWKQVNNHTFLGYFIIDWDRYEDEYIFDFVVEVFIWLNVRLQKELMETMDDWKLSLLLGFVSEDCPVWTYWDCFHLRKAKFVRVFHHIHELILSLLEILSISILL